MSEGNGRLVLRTFIAIQLSAELKRHISDLQAEFKRQAPELRGLSWVNPEGIHLTLRFLGDIEESQVEAITSVLRTAAAPKQTAETQREEMVTKISIAAFAFAVALAAPAAAHQETAGKLAIGHPWVRAAEAGGKAGR